MNNEPSKSFTLVQQPLMWASPVRKKGYRPTLEEVIESARAVAKSKVEAAQAHLDAVEARAREIFQNLEKE
jgi:hypothetical protein